MSLTSILTNLSHEEIFSVGRWAFGAGALAYSTKFLFKDEDSYDAPPVVPGYPVIGNTLQFMSDPQKLMGQSLDKACYCVDYGDVFTLNIGGRPVTMVGLSCVDDLVKTKDNVLSFNEAADDFFQIKAIFGSELSDDYLHSRLARASMSKSLNEFAERSIHVIEAALDERLGDLEVGEEKSIDDIMEFMQRVIAKSSAAIFVGEASPACNDVDFLDTVENFIGECIKAILFGRVFPKWTIPSVINSATSIPKHLEVARKTLFPIIAERRQMAAELGDAFVKPNDFIQWAIDDEKNGEPLSSELIVQGLMALVFVSVATTAINLTHMLYDVAGRQQHISELLSEQEAVLAQHDGKLTKQALDKMKMLDSFFRESLRVNLDSAHTFRKTLEPWTLSNGMVVPKGHTVYFLSDTAHLNANVVGEAPESFNPWRTLNTNKPSTRVGTDNIAFGFGRHACPGRFIASMEIEIAMSVLLRKFEFRTISGTRPANRPVLGTNLTPAEPIIFKRRV
ncbi:cytochrome P450 [Jimgerdemannia flammicorona]|uniref:Cytochrome P450 n=1 Tax=Jimgerdemannia flammicorona TaxID=994334 RepID=A0A433QLQ7_9FUNG|nr:cytochrome P450 [Jimgerdemannia flammicorona]